MNDDEHDRVLAIVRKNATVSVSEIQNRLGIGYERACRALIRAHEKRGLHVEDDMGVFDRIPGDQDLRRVLFQGGPLWGSTGVARGKGTMLDAMVLAGNRLRGQLLLEGGSVSTVLLCAYSGRHLGVSDGLSLCDALRAQWPEIDALYIGTIIRPSYETAIVVTLLAS